MNVLIIDAHDGVREMLVEALTQMDHSVYSAKNDAEGMGLFKSTSIDLIICDLDLSYPNEAIQALPCYWKYGKFDTAKILTSVRHENLERFAFFVKAVALPKPFTGGELNAAIEEAISKTQPELHA